MRSDRIISSIPKEIDNTKEESQCPHFNDSKNENWIYPSPKMFWDAMKRKGTLPEHLKDPDSVKTKEELDWIVTIHNIVNEKCWLEICKWEKFKSDREFHIDDKTEMTWKLQRFLGRPNDLSPRAWFKSTILGYRKPFDRHDWYVTDENDPITRRYIIDFYSATSSNSTEDSGVAFHLDVRPALDSVDSIKLRIKSPKRCNRQDNRRRIE